MNRWIAPFDNRGDARTENAGQAFRILDAALPDGVENGVRVRDLLKDPFYLRLERKQGWFFVYVAHALVIVAAGALFGFVFHGEALRYAASWGVWAVAVRTVFVLHGTWSVNSVAHLFGYRNYETRDHSTNNWLVALISHGEGWHNNHHAEPRSAVHGHRWWEYDMSWWVIRTWERIGLVKDVVRPKVMQNKAA